MLYSLITPAAEYDCGMLTLVRSWANVGYIISQRQPSANGPTISQRWPNVVMLSSNQYLHAFLLHKFKEMDTLEEYIPEVDFSQTMHIPPYQFKPLTAADNERIENFES